MFGIDQKFQRELKIEIKMLLENLFGKRKRKISFSFPLFLDFQPSPSSRVSRTSLPLASMPAQLCAAQHLRGPAPPPAQHRSNCRASLSPAADRPGPLVSSSPHLPPRVSQTPARAPGATAARA